MRFASGDDPVYVAEQGGWTDPAFAIRVYAKAVRRRERLTGKHLEAFDAAIDWAQMGTSDDFVPDVVVSDPRLDSPQTALDSE
jgi:hypothetical protein